MTSSAQLAPTIYRWSRGQFYRRLRLIWLCPLIVLGGALVGLALGVAGALVAINDATEPTNPTPDPLR